MLDLNIHIHIRLHTCNVIIYCNYHNLLENVYCIRSIVFIQLKIMCEWYKVYCAINTASRDILLRGKQSLFEFFRFGLVSLGCHSVPHIRYYTIILSQPRFTLYSSSWISVLAIYLPNFIISTIIGAIYIYSALLITVAAFRIGH